MFKKLKEKKGFTLVELIVVLVILAILAALLIPALTGYIDKAKNKSVIAETRQTVMAAQTLYDEEYAKVKTGGTVSFGSEDGDKKIALATVAKLAEVDTCNVISIAVDKDKNKISELVYDNGQKKCTYKPADAASNTDGDYNVETSTRK